MGNIRINGSPPPDALQSRSLVYVSETDGLIKLQIAATEGMQVRRAYAGYLEFHDVVVQRFYPGVRNSMLSLRVRVRADRAFYKCFVPLATEEMHFALKISVYHYRSANGPPNRHRGQNLTVLRLIAFTGETEESACGSFATSQLRILDLPECTAPFTASMRPWASLGRIGPETGVIIIKGKIVLCSIITWRPYRATAMSCSMIVLYSRWQTLKSDGS